MNSIFVKIVKIEQHSDAIVPPLTSFFKEGSYYKALKYKNHQGDPVYEIFVDNEIGDNEGITSFHVHTPTQDNKMFSLHFDEIKEEDIINEELSEDDIDRLYNTLTEGVDIDSAIDEEIMEIFDDRSEEEKERQAKEKEEKLNRNKIPRMDFPKDMEDAITKNIDMDYVKFLMYELRETHPTMFISMYNMLSYMNKTR